MSERELRDLKALYEDEIIDEEEYKEKLKELKGKGREKAPAKAKVEEGATSASATSRELRDLKALYEDGILDEEEYREKLKELQGKGGGAKARATAKAPAKAKAKKGKAKAAEEGYEGMSCAKLKAACKEQGMSQSGEKGVLIWRAKPVSGTRGRRAPTVRRAVESVRP